MKPSISIESLFEDLNSRIHDLRKNHREVTRYRKIVDAALLDGQAYYSINTGFGGLASKRIKSDQLKQLQKNLILSHAVGVGPAIPAEISRLILELKIHSLGYGNSGISEQTFRQLLDLHKYNLIPVIPQHGSVGASGDLAPLAHMSLPLIGEGYIWDTDATTRKKAASALKKAGLKPIELQPKDGLALINGTQFMSAYAALIFHRTKNLLKACDIIAAMSLSAIRGSKRPFDARVQKLRAHPGQQVSADNFRKLLRGSQIMKSHEHCERIQDPYSFRCAAVVHGASRMALEHCISIVETEINSVTDNPLVFEDGDIISAGNFHGQPLALALDYAALALSELASISERRTYFLLTGHDGLPLQLIADGGLQSGFMIAQYTAASLVSENKVLSHPACVDSIPTSLGQEDHVSMGSISATKLYRILHNLEHVLSIELLAAAQGMDFRSELNPGKALGNAHRLTRQKIRHRDTDCTFERDLFAALELVRDGSLVKAVEKEVGGLG